MAENEVLRFCLLEAAEPVTPAGDLVDVSTTPEAILRCWNFSRIDESLL